MARKIRFAGYPSAFVYPEPNKRSKWVNHLLWGEWVEIREENNDGWAKVNVRGENDGWMQLTDLQPNKLVEIYFVDIGQGDGCLVISPLPTPAGEEPRDRAILIDAGKSDNMLRFINWKFHTKNTANPPFRFDDVIISHGDNDHYGGFQAIFENDRFEFGNVYHNGLVERAVGKSLGTHEKLDGINYQTELVSTHEAMEALTSDDAVVGGRSYPKLMREAVKHAKVRMLSCEDKHLPGYDDQSEVKIEVLAPFTQSRDGDPRRLLPRFSNDGKTKNGHSVVIRLVYGEIRILLGGDLNVPAENYLLECHTGKKIKDTDPSEIIAGVKDKFESDVAKACHHGSGDFSTLFLRAVNAIATVISSGDDEPHAHPRPNTLGALGKYGRGEFPLIFSTELARSAKEKIKRPSEIREQIDDLLKRIVEADTDQKKKQLEKRKEELLLKLGRTIETFGMINVRTDGEKVMIAQKLEQRADRGLWDIHCLEKIDGVLAYKNLSVEDD
jgi:beta-lactamase superfamily II metal-dependent hydrolase